ncbi:uncharacterized protein LOC134225138 [Armigeres subalbatus]|uniref:uncharacterized protein LOC134225138 n=1 Tax=Armigeres subalbatus TaxID=124917 RepID=UPI002ED52153
MKQFINPLVVAFVLISVLNRQLVNGLPSSKLSSLSSSSSLSSASSSSSLDGSNGHLKDLKTDGTSFWSPQPEYYHERDRYGSRPGSDFVTSFGSFENKYGGGSSLPSSASYGSKDRYSPFSSGGSGSYYTSGGVFDKKPYGPPQPVDFPSGYGHEYDAHYDYNQHIGQGHAFSTGHHYAGKDYKSLLLPIAGAALLGIAAALVANPVLLHLGAFAAGKRKRRDVSDNAQDLAYRGHLAKSHPLKAPKV